MDLFKLRIFIEIGESGNLTRASRNLNISQPAMSAQLKSLEDSLGYSLFHRSSRGMDLTEQGVLLMDYARDAIRSAANFDDMARTLGKGKETVYLGLNTDSDVLRIDELLPALSGEGEPPVIYNLLQTRSEDFEASILARKIQGGFFYGTCGTRDIGVIPLRDIPIHAVLPEAWSVPHDFPGDLPGLAKYPWIWTSENCPFSQTVTAYFSRNGYSPERILYIDDEVLIGSLVEREVGCSFLAEPIALIHGERKRIRTFPIPGLTVSLNFGYGKEWIDHTPMGELVERVRMIWGVIEG